MLVKNKIIDTILEGATVTQVQKTAMEQGMCTLRQDGIIKVLEGITTMEEIYRVTNSM